MSVMMMVALTIPEYEVEELKSSKENGYKKLSVGYAKKLISIVIIIIIQNFSSFTSLYKVVVKIFSSQVMQN